MSTVQWRPYINALTTPRSYKPQVIPRNTNGYKKLAEEISLPDLAGSLLSGLEVTVQNAAELEELIRTNYEGRLVDILNVLSGV